MKKFTTSILLAVCFLSACGEFLEPDSPNEYTPKTALALDEMLIGNAYHDLAGSSRLFQLHNIFDDDVTTQFDEGYTFEKTSGADAVRGPMAEAIYSWDPDFSTIAYSISGTQYGDNIWENYYQKILGSNVALDYIGKVRGTAEEKASIKAQAYALRAFHYFHLVNLFGEPYNHNKQALGVPLKLDSDLDLTYRTRNTVEEVYVRIMRDLELAEEAYLELPVKQQFSRNYRTSLPMVQLLKSRVCLHMDNTEEAAKYARKVVEDWGMTLYDLNTFTPTAQIPYPQFVTYDNPEVIWPFGSAINSYTWATIKVGNGTTGSNSDRYIFVVSEELRGSYPAQDLRPKHYWLVQSGTQGNSDPAPNYRPIGKGMPNGVESINGSYYAFSMRLSEAYLNLAEALALTDPGEALRLINELRRHRIPAADLVQVSGLTGQALLDFVREERRRELCFEGHRWFDLRRYGMPSITRIWRDGGAPTAAFTLEKEDDRYTLPIHFQVIEKNPGIERNPSQLK